MNHLDRAKKRDDKLHGLNWGQCIEELQDEVKSPDDYDTNSE